VTLQNKKMCCDCFLSDSRDHHPQFSEDATMNDNLAVKVRSVIAGHFRVDVDRLTDEARLYDDLGADWLDRLELIIAIEDQVAGFGLADVVVDQIDTVGDLMRLVESMQDRGTGAMMSGGAPS
jgi:acyl carrier protein